VRLDVARSGSCNGRSELNSPSRWRQWTMMRHCRGHWTLLLPC
jgi:hypothetical protein